MLFCDSNLPGGPLLGAWRFSPRVEDADYFGGPRWNGGQECWLLEAVLSCSTSKFFIKVCFWRWVGTVVVRYPLPVLTVSNGDCSCRLSGFCDLWSTTMTWNIYPTSLRKMKDFLSRIITSTLPVWSQIFYTIKLDNNMLNTADFLILDKLDKGIFRVTLIWRVPTIFRSD